MAFQQGERFIETARRNRKEQTATGLRVGEQKPSRLRGSFPIGNSVRGFQIVAAAAGNAIAGDQFEYLVVDRRNSIGKNFGAHATGAAH